MTPYREGKAQIKKLNILILIGAMIFISMWVSVIKTVDFMRSNTKKIITSQNTVAANSGITAQLTDIRTVLKMCEEFPPPDPERLKRIGAEIRGNYNNFPSQEEMIEQLESYD